MKKITDEQYDLAKTLLSHGLNHSLTAGVVKLSGATVGVINRSTDLEDYRRIVRQNYLKYHADNKPAEVSLVPSPADITDPSDLDTSQLLLNLAEQIGQLREASDLQTKRLEKLIDMHASIPEAKLSRLFGKQKLK